MTARRAPFPSPLAGEGAERRSREAGEGALAEQPSADRSSSEALSKRTPHPDRAARGRPSPARGEGSGGSNER